MILVLPIIIDDNTAVENTCVLNSSSLFFCVDLSVVFITTDGVSLFL